MLNSLGPWPPRRGSRRCTHSMKTTSGVPKPRSPDWNPRSQPGSPFAPSRGLPAQAPSQPLLSLGRHDLLVLPLPRRRLGLGEGTGTPEEHSWPEGQGTPSSACRQHIPPEAQGAERPRCHHGTFPDPARGCKKEHECTGAQACHEAHARVGAHTGTGTHTLGHTQVLACTDGSTRLCYCTHMHGRTAVPWFTHTGLGRGGAVGCVCAHPRWITQPCPWGLRPLQFEPTPAAVWAWSQQGTAGWPTAESGPVVQGLEGSHLTRERPADTTGAALGW